MSHCHESPSGALLQAFGEFNRRDWFECHETLEDLWIGTEGEMRYFYQGILQLAVALHHWRNGNFRGADLLLAGGVEYLQRVQPVCQRIDVAGLIAATARFREALNALGPERMQALDESLIPRLILVSS